MVHPRDLQNQTKDPESRPTYASEDHRWQAVVARDSAADGVFYYSVVTTGVYCRPSCAARLARRENVAFHSSCTDAETAGFRPCKRCRPKNAQHPRSPAKTAAKNTQLLREYMFIYFAIKQCSLGTVLVAATEHGIVAILLGDDPDTLAKDLQHRFPKAHCRRGDHDLGHTVAEICSLIEAPFQKHELQLDLYGTAFQQRVWQALRDIPAGQTASYREIAKVVGVPKAARAVAQACASNPIAILIPCHRVVRSDGGMSGYRWGIERKRALLEREYAS